jgi:hypothetical protein
MKWLLLATVIEDPGYTNRVSHVHMSVERDRLRCTCRWGPMAGGPIAYVSSNIEMPSRDEACNHVRGLFEPGFVGVATVNFTQAGREEFEWRYAVRKLALSAP